MRPETKGKARVYRTTIVADVSGSLTVIYHMYSKNGDYFQKFCIVSLCIMHTLHRNYTNRTPTISMSENEQGSLALRRSMFHNHVFKKNLNATNLFCIF